MATSGTGSAASKMFLLAAVAMGVLATVLAFSFINSAGSSQGGPQVRIVTAKRDLPPDATLDPDRDLRVESIPAKFDALARLTLDPSSVASYRGQRVNRQIPAGQPVFLADIAAYANFTPKAPFVALPIQAEAGIAIPGDWVQVMVTRPDLSAAVNPAAGGRMPFVATFAAEGKPFRVIAVGGALFRTRSAVMAADAGGSSSSNKTVTLEATDQDALEIQGALGNGSQKATLVIVAPPATAPGQ